MIIRALLIITALLIGSASASTYTFGKNGEHTATVEPVFSILPSVGYAPYTVTIQTKLDAPRTFRIDATSSVSPRWGNSDTLTSTFTLSCPPQGKATHEILIPILPDIRAEDQGSSPTLRLSIFTSGSNPSTDYLNGLNGSAPFRAMGEHLASDNLEKLDEAIEKENSSSSSSRNRDQFAASFVPETLPSDWRAYSGIDELFISSTGWARIPAPSRAAITSWIHTGGHLFYYATGGTTPDPASLDLPSTPISGKITYLQWDEASSDLPIDTTIKEAKSRESSSSFIAKNLVKTFKDENAPTRAAIGTRSFNSGLVIIILLAFALLVGPINLFKLAGPGRRHRLFITTPIISIATSLLLLIVIFVQDGLGGKGQRFAHLQVAHDARQAIISQAQYSRTGVLLGSRFTAPKSSIILPAPVGDETKWNAYTRENSRPTLSFQHSQDNLSGDWFRSRSEQAHVIKSIRSTRARFERKASPEGTPPTLTSAFEFPLQKIYVCDENSNHWTSKSTTAPGTPPTFTSITSKEYEAAFKKLSQGSTNYPHRGAFFALADASSPAAKAFFVPTLESIRWKNDTLFVTGTLPPAP